MAEWGKDWIARQTADLRVNFDMALPDKRKYRLAECRAFVQSARLYKITAGNPMIHKSAVKAVNDNAGVPGIGMKANPWRPLVEAAEWRASCSRATIQASRVMSLPAY